MQKRFRITPGAFMTMMTTIVVFSVLFQLAAAVLALRLITITSHKSAWLMIALAITLMAFRRIESLTVLLAGGTASPSAITFEVAGLAISLLMFFGIYLIRPLFAAMVRSGEDLRTLNAKLEGISKDQQKLILDLQDAAASIKTLKGMLPICASCKKVRDDKGYWNQIEAYVSDHSDAEFTHALCPECAGKLYPEFCPKGVQKT
jgi:hypothetical protein